MRIFYCAQGSPNETALAHSKLWYVNLCLPLQDLGHEVIQFDHHYLHAAYNLDPERSTDQLIIAKHRTQFGDELLTELKTIHRRTPIDIFFSYFSSAHVEPDVIRAIGNMGIVTINWYCNASYQFRLVKDLAPAYHYSLVPEKFRLEDYRHAGANPIFCQEAANPNVYTAYDVPRDLDVTFVGQKYGDRSMYIEALVQAGVDVRVWGPHWATVCGDIPRWTQFTSGIMHVLRGKARSWMANGHAWRYGSPLTDEELIKMYSRSKVSLGFSRVADLSTQIRQVRLRDIEAPMSGAFYLTEYCEELEECFDIGREIVCFKNAEDLVDKAKYFLAHDSERERIRHAGMRRARKDHSWHRRFADIFETIGMNERVWNCGHSST